mmetsp:Transcript_22525/g.44509  ORF Transcript_22525/g.44509 Transcript_22525/m.44509 type:complete len:282 (-) Transcript_22525:149-994(-)
MFSRGATTASPHTTPSTARGPAGRRCATTTPLPLQLPAQPAPWCARGPASAATATAGSLLATSATGHSSQLAFPLFVLPRCEKDGSCTIHSAPPPWPPPWCHSSVRGPTQHPLTAPSNKCAAALVDAASSTRRGWGGRWCKVVGKEAAVAASCGSGREHENRKVPAGQMNAQRSPSSFSSSSSASSSMPSSSYAPSSLFLLLLLVVVVSSLPSPSSSPPSTPHCHGTFQITVVAGGRVMARLPPAAAIGLRVASAPNLALPLPPCGCCLLSPAAPAFNSIE